MTKTAKERAKDGDMSKIDAREARLRADFESMGGITGVKMRGILWLINSWYKKARPDLVHNFLFQINALHLMSLPEHRHGVAGAVVAIISSLPKREQAAYRGMPVNELPFIKDPVVADAGEETPADGVPIVTSGKARSNAPFKALIDSAYRLAIPVEDVLDLRPGHVDFLWMQWLVSRDDVLLNRLVRLTTNHPSLDVKQEGAVLLRAHIHLQPVADRLRAVQAFLAPAAGRVPPNVPKAEVDALGQFLVKGGAGTSGAGLSAIILVGWTPGDEGGFFVVTPDGVRPPNCPEKWHQRPVAVHKATEAEMEAHRAFLSARDEP
jgi:hypothetical protein